MARSPKARDIGETYVIPLLLALVLIVVSSLLDAIRVVRLGEALVLIAAILLGMFLTQYLAFRSLRVQERDVLFEVLKNIAFSETRGSVAASGVLTETEVLAIEATAKEVWVYAYDLNWEGPSSPFATMVLANLDNGVKYRYLVPEAPDVLLRVAQIQNSLSRGQRPRELVKFRSAKRPPAFMELSVTIYNPTFLRKSGIDDDPLHPTDTVVVFFPHLQKYGSFAEISRLPFLAIRGVGTAKFQEEFVTQWEQSETIEPSPHDI